MERVAPNGTCAYARARIDTSAISRRSRRTMKAIQYHRFGGPEVLEYVDVPSPSPGAGEVLIETTAVGVNFPDIRERLGIYNQKETRVGGVTLPQIGGVQAPSVTSAILPSSLPMRVSSGSACAVRRCGCTNPVSGRWYGIAEPFRESTARGLETRPFVAIVEAGDRHQLALVEPDQRRVDHVLWRHDD